jgi:hypothetical protein
MQVVVVAVETAQQEQAAQVVAELDQQATLTQQQEQQTQAAAVADHATPAVQVATAQMADQELSSFGTPTHLQICHLSAVD